MSYLDLQKIEKLCKGNPIKKLKYLNQFLEIITPSLAQLKTALKTKDKSTFRKTLHFISPQLVFFGLFDIPDLLKKVEKDSIPLTSDSLNKTIQENIFTIEKAITEIKLLVETMTKNQ